MIFKKLPKIAHSIILGLTLGGLSAATMANEFADDFSSDSIRFTAGTFSNSSGIYSITPDSDGLALSTNATDVSATGSVYINVNDASNSIGMDFTHLSSSSVESGAHVNAFLEATLYSENPNSSIGDRQGTIEAELTIGYDQNKMPVAFYCLFRDDGNGNSTRVENACGQFDTATLAMGENAQIDIALDKPNGQLIFTVNNVSKVLDIGGDVYPPGYSNRRIQLYSDGGAASAAAILHEVRLGEKVINMATNPPIMDRYTTNFESGATVALENEKLAVKAVSVAEDDRWTDAELYLLQPTDYVEAELTLSSASDISGEAFRARTGIASNFYNTVADGGVDGRIGDVTAELNMEARGNGLRRIEFCLFRRDDRDGDARTGLLNPDNPNHRCDNLPLLLEFDQPYRVALALDRERSELVVRVNGYSRRVPLNTAFYDAYYPFARISIASRNDGIAIGTIDNVRTSQDALTATEQSAGATQPGAFPAPIDPATLVVDSTVKYPFDFSDTETQLDFIDDFSGITSDFGFWSGRERGESGVSWDGQAIVFETSSAADNDDGNWTEFYLDPRSDSVEAVLSLSSGTNLPVDGDAEVQVRAIFYNDTQDYGFDEQSGDMEATLRIRLSGNGERDLSAKLRRINADGISSSVSDFSGEPRIVPTLDQPYKLSLVIDRENGVLRFGIDGEITDYQIPTGVFLPSRQRILISVYHSGSSGVAIGKIHSVKTDTIDENFSLVAPVIAPYRPSFDAQHPGRLVETVDGRLRLEADGTLTSGRDPRIVALHGSDYLGATIELASGSVIQPEGTVFIGLAGTMYNDLADGPGADTGSEGNVYAAVRLTADGSGERYVQTCAWRSNDSDFGSATELLSGTSDTCARFSLVPEFDTAYPAFIKLDRVSATLTFGFNGETVVYNITTPINKTGPFHGVRARTSDGSKVVAWADDLSFSENPVPLADSAYTLAADSSGTNGTGVTDSNGSETSGGGSFGPGFVLLMLFSVAGTTARRAVSKSHALMP